MDHIEYRNGYAYVDGHKFRRDKRKGYYLSTTNIGSARKRLHIYIWEKHNGPVPAGMEINHIDENKDNNDISNLECLTRHEHRLFHVKHDYQRLLPKWRSNLDKFARPKAAEWHRSAEGRQKKSIAHTGVKEKRRYVKRCKNCGKVYRTAIERSKFCSPACQSDYRRKSGKDNEQRTCAFCGKKFIANRYRTKQTCSKLCQDKLRLLNNKTSRRGTTRLNSGKYIGQVGFQGKKYHTTVFDKEEDAYAARNKLIDQIINQK